MAPKAKVRAKQPTVVDLDSPAEFVEAKEKGRGAIAAQILLLGSLSVW